MNRIQSTLPGEGGTPLRTEVLADGTRRHHMSDGKVFEEDGQPYFRLEYQSVFAKAFPGETYTREISIFGLAEQPHLFNAWCYTYNALRSYAFCKVVTLEEIATGERVSGEELRVLMGGSHPPNREPGGEGFSPAGNV